MAVTKKGVVTIIRECLISLIGGVIIFALIRYLPSLPGRAKPPLGQRHIQVGQGIPGVHLHQPGANKTIVIAVADSCLYSQRNLAFHKRLVREAKAHNIPIYVIVPDQHSQAMYTSALDLPVDQVQVTSLAKANIVGTPTVLLLDSNNKVARHWEGLLPDFLQDVSLTQIVDSGHFISRPDPKSVLISDGVTTKAATEQLFGDPTNTPAVLQVGPISSNGLNKLADSMSIVDLSARESFHPEGELKEQNIPADELSVRAKFELSRKKPVLLKCTDLESSECDLTWYSLASQGFRYIYLLDRGGMGAFCKITYTE